MSKQIVEYLATQIEKGVTEVVKEEDRNGCYRSYSINIILPIGEKVLVKQNFDCVISNDVKVDGERLDLTDTEERLLFYLAQYKKEEQDEEKRNLIKEGLLKVTESK
jgi:hypothetical protein